MQWIIDNPYRDLIIWIINCTDKITAIKIYLKILFIFDFDILLKSLRILILILNPIKVFDVLIFAILLQTQRIERNFGKFGTKVPQTHIWSNLWQEKRFIFFFKEKIPIEIIKPRVIFDLWSSAETYSLDWIFFEQIFEKIFALLAYKNRKSRKGKFNLMKQIVSVAWNKWRHSDNQFIH